MAWKKLPIEDSIVDEVRVFGNGKDCEVTIKTKEPKRVVQFMMRDPNLEIDLQGRIKTVIFSDGDEMCLGTRYLPLENVNIRSNRPLKNQRVSGSRKRRSRG